MDQGFHIWDYAAPSLIVRHGDLTTSTLQKDPGYKIECFFGALFSVMRGHDFACVKELG
jgi:hypothetical protein